MTRNTHTQHGIAAQKCKEKKKKEKKEHAVPNTHTLEQGLAPL
jgi:hypothetical protein